MSNEQGSHAMTQYPTKEQMAAVLADINAGHMSCAVIAARQAMDIEDVASCAMILMESDLITCDEVEAPE